MNKALVFASLLCLVFWACNTNKGWTQEDKDKVMSECTTAVQANTGGMNVDANAFCSCLLTEVMKKYKSPEEIGMFDMNKIQDAVMPCATELMKGMGAQMDSAFGELDKALDTLNTKIDTTTK